MHRRQMLIQIVRAEGPEIRALPSAGVQDFNELTCLNETRPTMAGFDEVSLDRLQREHLFAVEINFKRHARPTPDFGSSER